MIQQIEEFIKKHISEDVLFSLKIDKKKFRTVYEIRVHGQYPNRFSNNISFISLQDCFDNMKKKYLNISTKEMELFTKGCDEYHSDKN